VQYLSLRAEAIETFTYSPILLPHLKHLHIRSRMADNGGAAGFTPALSLASNFLSRLNPHSLALSPHASTDLDQYWVCIGTSRPIWERATSTWTRLRSISFIDCSRIWLETGVSAAEGLSPRHVPASASSIAFSWSFTQKVGGYAGAAKQGISEGNGPVLEGLAGFWKDWPCVQELGIEMDIGDGEADRVAFEKGLPEKLRRLIRY
jgi:hypothetical protein